MRLGQIAPPWIPVPPRDYGGTELIVDLLVRSLTAKGWQIQLCCSGDSTISTAKFCPYPHSFWPPEKFSENFHLAKSLAFFRAQPPEVIHSHLEGAAGFWELAERPAPLLITLHTPITPAKKEYLFRFPEVQLVAVSDFQRRQLAGHPRLQLIPHGIELTAYPFTAHKEDYLIFLGRIYPDKGLHTALKVARRRGRRLLIAGPVYEPDRPYFLKEIQPHLDGRRAVYLGPADFHRKVELLRRAQALILPLEVDEAFGLAMVEALACGTPVLAFRRGAAPEIIDSGVTGFLAGSVAELEQAVEEVKHLDPQACRFQVATRFTAPRMTAAYEALYQQMRQSG